MYQLTFLIYMIVVNAHLICFKTNIQIFMSETLFYTKIQGWASVLFKRTFRSLRSFPFFIKEHSNLCVLFRSL